MRPSGRADPEPLLKILNTPFESEHSRQVVVLLVRLSEGGPEGPGHLSFSGGPKDQFTRRQITLYAERRCRLVRDRPTNDLPSKSRGGPTLPSGRDLVVKVVKPEAVCNHGLRMPAMSAPPQTPQPRGQGGAMWIHHMCAAGAAKMSA
jgi:hypothetical protein